MHDMNDCPVLMLPLVAVIGLAQAK
jgi:hypothetical protein